MKTQQLFVILCALAALSAGCLKGAPVESPLPENLRSGLVLFYNFDAAPDAGTVPDASGHGNNGSATGVQWVANSRNAGGCAQFGLTNSYITVPNNPSLNPPRFSLAAWIKTDYTDKVWRRIFDKSFPKSFDLTMGGDVPNGRSFRGVVGLEIGDAWAGSGMKVADDRWHHVVGTFDGAELRLYVDGQLRRRTAVKTKPAPTPVDLTIGHNPPTAGGGDDSSFNGEMDDVMMFNRALSAAEVQALFTTQGGVSAPPRTKTAAPAPAPAAKPDAATRLKEVKSLYDQGLINKTEYDQKVKEIMDSL
ncbi:MAG TPA: LamG-like jellyroll fold domain-containing protein [Verrucomicrobiae bacterium]|nr:LamG-like jellyroll fold domain-containing protein [Verrucomicrobiae bacterium]